MRFEFYYDVLIFLPLINLTFLIRWALSKSPITSGIPISFLISSHTFFPRLHYFLFQVKEHTSTQHSTIFLRIGSSSFLRFWINLMVQNTRKVTEPNFSAKLPLAQIWAKSAKNGPKMDFFNIYSKLSHYFWLETGKKCRTLWLGCMVHYPYVWENSRLVKFWAKRPESSRPIRLLHFQNAITSKPFDRFLIYFVWSKSTTRGINRKYFGGN